MSNKLPKTMTENGIQYRLNEATGTYLPELTLEDQKEIGKYGLLRRTFLKEKKTWEYQAMLIEGTLNSHLAEIDETAQKRLDLMLPKMMQEAGATEELKAKDQMAWVGIVNNLKASIEEQILNELIYI
ncbi:TnpV protein [Ruminococcus sp.]|uniref:TnpV protein n=1 Tax=Ruminococcus sp. TaxID=41978 RepID=UPI003436425D